MPWTSSCGCDGRNIQEKLGGEEVCADYMAVRGHGECKAIGVEREEGRRGVKRKMRGKKASVEEKEITEGDGKWNFRVSLNPHASPIIQRIHLRSIKSSK